MSQYSFGQLQQLWISAGGNAQSAPVAAAVAMAESGGNSDATNGNGNGSTDRGLWQINSVHGAQSTTDPLANARAAVAISNNGQSWRAWCTAYSDGACGTAGGTYMTSGSPVLKALAAAGGSVAGVTTGGIEGVAGYNLVPGGGSGPLGKAPSVGGSGGLLGPVLTEIGYAVQTAVGGIMFGMGLIILIIAAAKSTSIGSAAVKVGKNLGAGRIAAAAGV